MAVLTGGGMEASARCVRTTANDDGCFHHGAHGEHGGRRDKGEEEWEPRMNADALQRSDGDTAQRLCLTIGRPPGRRGRIGRYPRCCALPPDVEVRPAA